MTETFSHKTCVSLQKRYKLKTSNKFAFSFSNRDDDLTKPMRIDYEAVYGECAPYRGFFVDIYFLIASILSYLMQLVSTLTVVLYRFRAR